VAVIGLTTAFTPYNIKSSANAGTDDPRAATAENPTPGKVSLADPDPI